MANISSNSLFHFTCSLERLVCILTNGFYTKYSFEQITPLSQHPIAIPMICFCDIPLSQIKDHTTKYGKYGIGMTKKWGMKKELNPVLYLSNSSDLPIISDLTISFLELLNKIEKVKSATGPGLLELDRFQLIKEGEDAAFKMARYMKPYEGRLFRRQEDIQFYKEREWKYDSKLSMFATNVKFYDEREWRYVPKPSDHSKFWLSYNEYNEPNELAEANKAGKCIKLCFEPADIKYIVVHEEIEIHPMIDALKKIKKDEEKNIEILISRIITYQQISNDF